MKTAVGQSAPNIKAFTSRIDNQLRDIFADAITRANEIDPTYGQLLEVMQTQLLRGGKRLRPRLTYLAYTGLGGTNEPAIMQAAAGQELIHQFLLIHDDVIDRDLVRHGGPNVAGVYYEKFKHSRVPDSEALHYGSSFALLAGNASFALSLQVISGSGFTAEQKLAAMTSIDQMLFEIMGGQLLDVYHAIPHVDAPTVKQLLQIATFKTARYSFETPLEVGALLAGAAKPEIATLKEFATGLGIAFQLTDDLLGLYGDEATLGKSVTSDMCEGKQTLLLHYALEAASPAQAKQLETIWGDRGAGTNELEVAKDLVRQTGATKKVEDLCQTYLDSSLAALEKSKLSESARAELIEIAHFCITRRY
jgi:geranylgeranyl diphosphate synthase type II